MISRQACQASAEEHRLLYTLITSSPGSLVVLDAMGEHTIDLYLAIECGSDKFLATTPLEVRPDGRSNRTPFEDALEMSKRSHGVSLPEVLRLIKGILRPRALGHTRRGPSVRLPRHDNPRYTQTGLSRGPATTYTSELHPRRRSVPRRPCSRELGGGSRPHGTYPTWLRVPLVDMPEKEVAKNRPDIWEFRTLKPVLPETPRA